jgi:ATP-dependent protease HslVU (ClpYQ) peptidase subunit
VTTVVTDGKVMLADAQLTDGNVRIKYHGKIRKIGEYLVGGAGDPESLELFFRWYASPTARAPALGKNFEAIAVSKDGIFGYGRRLVPMKIEEPFYAIGSGFGLALGALEAGATPQEAMRIACKRDAYSGIEIVEISLEEEKLTRKKAGRKR